MDTIRSLYANWVARDSIDSTPVPEASSEDVTHLDRRGGHIGLPAGSKARTEIWPDTAEWLRERSN